jgi:sulfite reductase alpha subunit-like flavoprotein
LRIAESRASDKKCYVQNLIKEDKSFFADHLFKDKGVVFICGSAAMAKGVDT